LCILLEKIWEEFVTFNGYVRQEMSYDQ
jgi:hypothetical protein